MEAVKEDRCCPDVRNQVVGTGSNVCIMLVRRVQGAACSPT